MREPAADGVYIMYPFRTVPDAIDRVACERCGLPVWHHYSGELSLESEPDEAGSACARFRLYSFAEDAAHAVDERAFRN